MMRALGGCSAGEGSRADAPGVAPEGVDGRRRFEQSVAQARAGGRDRPAGGIDGIRSPGDVPDTAGGLPPTLEALAAAPLPLAVLAALGPAGAGGDTAVEAVVDGAHGNPPGAADAPHAVGVDRPQRAESPPGSGDGPVTSEDRSTDRRVDAGAYGSVVAVSAPAVAAIVPTGPSSVADSPRVVTEGHGVGTTGPSASSTSSAPSQPSAPADAPRAHSPTSPGEPVRRDAAGPGGSELERPGEPVPEVFTARAASTAVALAPTQPAAPPDSRAEVLAQWILSKLPLDAALDRTVTLTFPGAAVPIEQIVMTREAGVLRLWVTARAEGREQVQAALAALGDRLRSRGLRVGALALA